MGQFRKRRNVASTYYFIKILRYYCCTVRAVILKSTVQQRYFVAKNKSWWDNKCTEHMLVMLHAFCKKSLYFKYTMS